MKDICQYITRNIRVNGKKLEAFPSKERISVFTPTVQYFIGGYRQCDKTKELKEQRKMKKMEYKNCKG